ncbi:MAG: xanthine dehydrogenase family protein subunit M [Woeseiaceae bacterium]
MYIPTLELHEAASFEDATALLSQYSPDVRLLAGGTDVLIDLKTNGNGVGHLVTLSQIEAMRGISEKDDGLRIGALTTITEIDESPLISGAYEVLRDAASQMATLQIRNTATIGGNIAGANPCADLPPVLMVLDAAAIVISTDGQRDVPLQDFITGPRETILERNELLAAVLVPRPSARFGAAYARFGLRNGNAIAVASVAASVTLNDDGTVHNAHIALGAVAPVPTMVEGANLWLEGRELNGDATAEAARAAMEAAEPISDLRGSADYRRELVGVLTKRALMAAEQRAKA